MCRSRPRAPSADCRARAQRDCTGATWAAPDPVGPPQEESEHADPTPIHGNSTGIRPPGGRRHACPFPSTRPCAVGSRVNLLYINPPGEDCYYPHVTSGRMGTWQRAESHTHVRLMWGPGHQGRPEISLEPGESVSAVMVGALHRDLGGFLQVLMGAQGWERKGSRGGKDTSKCLWAGMRDALGLFGDTASGPMAQGGCIRHKCPVPSVTPCAHWQGQGRGRPGDFTVLK